MFSLTAAVLLASGSGPEDAKAAVVVDSAKREVVVTVGPYHVAAMPPGMKHEEMDKMDDHSTPVVRFDWPVDGWLRGFRVEVVDANDRPVDRSVVHHLIGVNFDRRQLLYPAVERLFGIGRETEDMMVPRTIGVPMKSGYRLGMYMAWQNETGKDLDGIKIRVRLSYSPTNLNPRPVDAMPLYMDVNLTVGGTNTFPVPAGRSEKGWEFVMPTAGRLIGFSGHLHDYGAGVRLEDVESGKVIATVKATRKPDGKLLKISRSLPGVSGDGIALKAGRKYRVVGIYDNPTGETIPGAMAHIAAVFAPDDISKWPALDLADDTLQEDLASLDEMGKKAAGGHEHSKHEQ
jgi:hypothetical protein